MSTSAPASTTQPRRADVGWSDDPSASFSAVSMSGGSPGWHSCRRGPESLKHLSPASGCGRLGFTFDQQGTSLDRAVARRRIDAEQPALIRSRLTASDQPRDARQASLVLEAVVEDLEVKRQLFERFDRECRRAPCLRPTPRRCVADIADPARHRERVLGLHFFSPAPAMKLVEVCPHRYDERRGCRSRRCLGLLDRQGAGALRGSARVNRQPAAASDAERRRSRPRAAGGGDGRDRRADEGAGRASYGPFELIGLDVSLAAQRALCTVRSATSDCGPPRCSRNSSPTAISAERQAAGSTTTRHRRPRHHHDRLTPQRPDQLALDQVLLRGGRVQLAAAWHQHRKSGRWRRHCSSSARTPA